MEQRQDAESEMSQAHTFSITTRGASACGVVRSQRLKECECQMTLRLELVMHVGTDAIGAGTRMTWPRHTERHTDKCGISVRHRTLSRHTRKMSQQRQKGSPNENHRAGHVQSVPED